MPATVQNNFRTRKSFAKIQKIIDIPNLINRKDVSDELKRKIFWDNPLRFYPRLKARVEKTDTKIRAAAG